MPLLVGSAAIANMLRQNKIVNYAKIGDYAAFHTGWTKSKLEHGDAGYAKALLIIEPIQTTID
jgi:hypothetical protein